MKSKVDYLKIISLTTTFLLCAGIISQTIYYLFFNISISEYLNPSEVLLLFTKDILRFIVVLFVSILIFVPSYPKETAYRLKHIFIEYVQMKSIKSRMLFYLNRKLFFSLLLFSFIIIALVMIIQKEKSAYINALVIALLLILQIIQFILWEYKRALRIKKELKKENEKQEIYFLSGFAFIFFVIVWSINDVRSVKYAQKYINVSFKISGQTIVSDSSKFYIGQTEKYLFYYNSKTDITTVFNRSDIHQIDFGKINYLKKE